MAQKYKKITIPITKPYLDGKEEKLVAPGAAFGVVDPGA